MAEPFGFVFREAEAEKSARSTRKSRKILFSQQRVKESLGTDEESDGRNHDRAEFRKPADNTRTTRTFFPGATADLGIAHDGRNGVRGRQHHTDIFLFES